MVSEPPPGPSSHTDMLDNSIETLRALMTDFTTQMQTQVSTLHTLIGGVANRVQVLESMKTSAGSMTVVGDPISDLGFFKPKSHEFPRFDGSSDPSEWKFKANRFFNCNNISDDDKRLTIASFYLEGEALQWYWHYSNTRESISWSNFLGALEDRFGALSSIESHGLLSKLR